MIYKINIGPPSGSHVFQWIKLILAILVGGRPMTNYAKLFSKQISNLKKKDFYSFSFLLLWQPEEIIIACLIYFQYV